MMIVVLILFGSCVTQQHLPTTYFYQVVPKKVDILISRRLFELGYNEKTNMSDWDHLALKIRLHYFTTQNYRENNQNQSQLNQYYEKTLYLTGSMIRDIYLCKLFPRHWLNSVILSYLKTLNDTHK